MVIDELAVVYWRLLLCRLGLHSAGQTYFDGARVYGACKRCERLLKMDGDGRFRRL
jgi:hypothetical protein